MVGHNPGALSDLHCVLLPSPVGEGQDARERRLGAETRGHGLPPAALPALRIAAAARAAVTARILTHSETRRAER